MFEVIPLFSGSSGNSILFRHDGKSFLIDAGMSCRNMCAALALFGEAPETINGVFVTHEHSDHIAGLEMLCKKYSLPVYINSFSADFLLRSRKFPYLCANISIFEPDTAEELFGMSVKSFRTPHDSCGSVGYRFDDEEDSFAYATDIGCVTRLIARNLFGAKKVILESNHDLAMLKNGRYPESLKARIRSDHGHLSNEDCAAFLPYLAANGTEKIWLGHLSKDNNTPQIALSLSQKALAEAGDANVSLAVAPRSVLT